MTQSIQESCGAGGLLATASLLFALALATAVYGGWGTLTMREPFTGAVYDEMDGIIPVAVLAASAVPFLLSLVVFLFSFRRAS